MESLPERDDRGLGARTVCYSSAHADGVRSPLRDPGAIRQLAAGGNQINDGSSLGMLNLASPVHEVNQYHKIAHMWRDKCTAFPSSAGEILKTNLLAWPVLLTTVSQCLMFSATLICRFSLSTPLARMIASGALLLYWTRHDEHSSTGSSMPVPT